MHTWSRKESPFLKSLLVHSEASYATMSGAPVANQFEEVCCGWKPSRPRAEYDLTQVKRRQRRPLGAVPNLQPLVQKPRSRGTEHPYMSGRLDENYAYTFQGGLSARAYSESHHLQMTHPPPPPPPLQAHTQALVLDPILPYRSSPNMAVSSRSQLEHILALQLKPELLVEQLIIENRLRTMSLNAFPVLEGIGFDGKQKLPAKSVSTLALHSHNEAVLVPEHRKHRRRKPNRRPPLQWCGLANSPAHKEGRDVPALVLPFDSTRKHRRQGFQGLGSVTSLPKLIASRTKSDPPRASDKHPGDTLSKATVGGQLQYGPLPVVEPELGTGKLKGSPKMKHSRLKPAYLRVSGGD